MDHLLQISGVAGRQVGGSDGVAEQFSGGMDLHAFDLKVRSTDRDFAMRIATGFLRVLSEELERSKDIMKA